MPYYLRSWQHFLAQTHTHATCRRNVSEWHQNRQKYCFWGIAIDTPALQLKLNQSRQLLAPYLLNNYLAQPHVTLYACGFMAEKRHTIDDYDHELFNTHRRSLEILNLKPFSLSVLGINSFTTAPFLEVVDHSNALANIRNALNTVRGENRHMDYIPHITIGLYAGAYHCKTITKLIDNACTDNTLSIPVNHITLMSYDAQNVCSALKNEYSIPLNTQPNQEGVKISL